jgi:hypothetical protein
MEVQKVRVRLHRLRGGEIDASLFVHTVGPDETRPQSVASRLNEPDHRFLPFEIEGRVMLVGLASIAAVELSEEPPEVATLAQVGGVRAPVEVVLATGRHLEGELLYEAPEARRRVLDVLNAATDRFLLMAAGRRYFLVQIEAIDQVRAI